MNTLFNKFKFIRTSIRMWYFIFLLNKFLLSLPESCLNEIDNYILPTAFYISNLIKAFSLALDTRHVG